MEIHGKIHYGKKSVDLDGFGWICGKSWMYIRKDVFLKGFHLKNQIVCKYKQKITMENLD